MSENLYPHEVIVKALRKPNSISDALLWMCFSLTMILLLMLTVFIFNVIANIMKITDAPVFITFGLNICFILTVILAVIGVIGLKQNLVEGY